MRDQTRKVVGKGLTLAPDSILAHFNALANVIDYQLDYVTSLMPRSHIHGSPRWFYYGLNLTDDPENAISVVRYGCTIYV